MGDASKKAVSVINSIPFENILGGPLSAAVYAQADAAQATINYIKTFAMEDSSREDGASEPIMVKFQFMQDGAMKVLSVPLLTLVPIPYMHIDDINLSFTADITACEGNHLQARYSNAAIDEERTEDDDFVMQNLISVNIHASTLDMPAGLATVLQYFGDNLVVIEDFDGSSGTGNTAAKEPEKEKTPAKTEPAKEKGQYKVKINKLQSTQKIPVVKALLEAGYSLNVAKRMIENLETATGLTSDQANKLFKDLIEAEVSATLYDPSGNILLTGANGGFTCPPVAPPAASTPLTYKVTLTDAGTAKLNVIKALKEVTGLGLKEAKDIVDNRGTAIEGTDLEKARKVAVALSGAGAKVLIVDSNGKQVS